ncbi:MAG: galactokinase [Bacteroidota bacterium]
MIDKIKDKYVELFDDNFCLYRAPGRINLLGEHTDYNDGFVLPASIDKAMVFAVGKNQTKSICNLYAYDLDEHFSFDLSKVSRGRRDWPNYIKGVIAEIYKRGKSLEGFNMVFGGNIPLGAGLSSSAALESGVGTALNDLFNLEFDKLELIKMAQAAEHNYAGVMCGIMDQFASVMGKDSSAFKLDCRTLEYDYFPLKLKNYQIILCDTQVKHSLASSEYNTRRKECEEGVEIIKKEIPQVVNLRDVSLEQVHLFESKMPEKVYDRCSYVVEENDRVEQATRALENNDIESLGQLMYATHKGLQHKYEVSCKELDFLVDLTKDLDYVAGSRMMGGGFGGCTINLVARDQINEFEELVFEAYKNEFDKEPKVYEIEVTDGAGKLNVAIV